MHLLNVKTQLRALIATGNRNMKPLLLDLADKLNIDLTIYTLIPVDQNEVLPDAEGNSLLYDVPMPKTWHPKPIDLFEKTTFRNWMQESHSKGLGMNDYVNRNKLLREIADTSATHFDEEIGDLLEYIKGNMTNPVVNERGEVLELNGLDLFIVDLATATCWAGSKFLCKVDKNFDQIKPLDDYYQNMVIVGGPLRRLFLYGRIIPKSTDPDKPE